MKDEWLSELCRLFQLVEDASRRRTSYVNPPRRLCQLIAEASEEFAFGRQADAHEAMVLLITRCLAGCVAAGDGSGTNCSKLGYKEKEKLEACSLIGHVFAMLLGQRMDCNNCGYTSPMSHVDYHLTVRVTLGMTEAELQKCRQDSSSLRWALRLPGSKGSESSASPTTLSALLDEYTRKEEILEWKCEKCNCRGGGKTHFIGRRPNVLMIYIDRRQDCNLFGKINRRVSFPSKLDIGPWLSDAEGQGVTSYSLYALCVHQDLRGSTASGHYVAYVKDSSDRWYLIDDETVRSRTWAAVQEVHPSLLFYMADQLVLPFEAEPPLDAQKPETPERAEAAEKLETTEKLDVPETPVEPEKAESRAVPEAADEDAPRTPGSCSTAAPMDVTDGGSSNTLSDEVSPAEKLEAEPEAKATEADLHTSLNLS